MDEEGRRGLVDPEGEFADSEDPLTAAKREFEEEVGAPAMGDPFPLEPVRQPSGKVIYAWAVRGDFDPSHLKSNTFSMEWPPRSGRQEEFPEVDRAGWFTADVAKLKIQKGQTPILEQLKHITPCDAVRGDTVQATNRAENSDPRGQQSLF